MEKYLSLLLMQLIVPVIIALITSIISVKLALRKFKSEKWWDRKLSCYIELAEAFSVIIIYVDMVIDIDLDDVQHDPKEFEKLRLSYNQSITKLQTQAYTSVIFIDKSSYESLLRFNNKLFRLETSSRDSRKLADLRESAETCLSIISEEAKRELGIKRSMS